MVASPIVASMPQRSYSYRRVSEHYQGKADRDGLIRQEDFAERISAEEGWALDDSLVFVDKGRSGYHGEHLKPTADLARFLKLVEDRQITPGSVLIIENIDRLSRQEVDVAYDLFRGLLKAGIWIATKFPRRIYKPGAANFMDLMEPIWLMYLAHQESLKKSERLTGKWERRREGAYERKAPIGNLCPAWIALSTDGYIPIPGRFQSVQMIFRLAIQGLGCLRIAQWLNAHADQYPPFTGGNARGKWSRAYVRKILRSRIPLGEYQPHSGRPRKPIGNPIPGYFPVLVNEEEWHLAQAAITQRRNTSGRPGHREANLFTGLVREFRSRERMSVRVHNNGRRKLAYRYLEPPRVVESSLRRNGGCPYRQFEDGILRSLSELKVNDVLPDSGIKDELQTRIGNLPREIGAIKNRLDEIQAEIEKPENKRSVSMLTKSAARLHDQIEAKSKELDALKYEATNSRSENLGRLQSLLDLLNEVRGTDQEPEIRQRIKAAIRWVVEEIWVLTQTFSTQKRVIHAQIYLRGGKVKYVRILPPNGKPHPSLIWWLGRADFREGNIGDAAIEAELLAQRIA